MTLPMFPTGPIADAPAPALRPYQERTVRLLRLHAQTHKKILCVAPCGAGKTVILAAIIRSSSLPVLFIAHRLELIDQCAEQLRRAGLTYVGVLRGQDEREDPSASIQVASIQTLARRDKPFLGKQILIIVDEAHRAQADSYRNILDCYPDAIVLGFTATPCRLDGRPLGEIFDVLEVGATYQELLKRPDWLVAPDVLAPPTHVDFSQVRTVGGDFDEGQLGALMGTLEGKIVEHWLAHAHRHPVFRNNLRVPREFQDGPRRPTFLFATTIQHSQDLCSRFEQAGVRVAHIDGNTPEDTRRAALRDLASGKLELVSNCNVLLEGVDVPEAKCVVHARPTQSLTLWRQSTSRILRPYRGIIPLILDHADNYARLGPPHEDLNWSLTKKPSRRSTAAPMKLCHMCFAYVEAGRILCPHCGAEFPVSSTDRNAPSETSAELTMKDSDAFKREYFNKYAVMARGRGYKPGFAAAKFKERYGVWPPREWSNAVKAEFDKDAIWKAMVEKRERRKAEEAAALAPESPRNDVPDQETIRAQFELGRASQAKPEPVGWDLSGTGDDDEELFADWFARQ